MAGPSRGEEPSMDLFINHPIFAETSAVAADLQSPPNQSPPKPQGLRNSLCIRDTDVIVAVGGELRMMPTPSQSTGRFAYKRLALSTPKFPINQILLNPNGKLLAVASSNHVAVVALPRQGYFKSLGDSVECRSVMVGSYFHDAPSPPITKIGWHPWGENGSTLMVLTADGVIREYDTSIHPDIPQQRVEVLTNKSRNKGFNANHDRAVSFTLGQGSSDWGFLTLFVLTANGEVYGLCPYIPRHAMIPSQYIENLEIYVNNQLGCLDRTTQYSDPGLVMAAESQRQFMKCLLRMASNQRLISVNPDLGIREVSVDSQKLGDRQSAIQGPYLFQPVPHELEDSEGGDATDLIYITSHGGGDQEGVAEMNILCISFQDGKVDICLDLQKLEGKWAPANTTTITYHGSRTTALPVLHVYESVDIGRNPDSKQVPAMNYPCFSSHPTLPDVVFVGHSFGIHCISMTPWTMELRSRLLGSTEEGFETAARHSEVIIALSTVSDDQSQSFPIIGMAFHPGISSAITLLGMSTKPTLGIRSVTAPKMRPPRVDHLTSDPPIHLAQSTSSKQDGWLGRSSSIKIDSDTHISLLAMQPYKAETITYKPISPLPSAAARTPEVTTETLRILSKASEGIRTPIRSLFSQIQLLSARIELQEEERKRQLRLEQELHQKSGSLQDDRLHPVIERFQKCTKTRDELKARIDNIRKVFLLAASPELSSKERVWFSELAELRGVLHGSAEWDENALNNRMRKLRKSMQELQELRAKIDPHPERPVQFGYTSPRPKTWGTDQMHRYVNRLQYLHKELQTLQDRVLTTLGGKNSQL